MNLQQLNQLTESAKKYRLDSQESLVRNNHMNEIEDGEVIQQRIIDAILTDFINYLGMRLCIDYAIYASDLVEP